MSIHPTSLQASESSSTTHAESNTPEQWATVDYVAKNGYHITLDGVLYPRISMELVKVENSRDIPKEWRESLVKE